MVRSVEAHILALCMKDIQPISCPSIHPARIRASTTSGYDGCVFARDHRSRSAWRRHTLTGEKSTVSSWLTLSIWDLSWVTLISDRFLPVDKSLSASYMHHKRYNPHTPFDRNINIYKINICCSYRQIIVNVLYPIQTLATLISPWHKQQYSKPEHSKHPC